MDLRITSNIAYSYQTVAIDDTHFQDCTFQNCELLYDGGAVIFERTRFTECDYLFGGHARRTLDLLKLIGFEGKALGMPPGAFGAIQ